MEDELVCGKCLHKAAPRIETKGMHKTAYCPNCGVYIKHLSYMPPLWYFGKYKGQLISSCSDLPYMEWAMAKKLFKGSAILKAAQDRIGFLKTGKHGTAA